MPRFPALVGLALALTLSVLLVACGQKPDLALEPDGSARAAGWQGPEPAGGYGSVLAVYAGGPDQPPMLGDYSRQGGTIRFKPRFAPAPGMTLRAVYRPPHAPPIERSAQVAASTAAPTPLVTAILPNADELPANLLKLYIDFSQPMAKGQAYGHLRILDAAGNVIEAPFVEIDQELWDPQGRRLTVLFDPGRIKRGVKPNQDIGAPLKAGARYRLIVVRGWQSAAGAPLAADAVKAFTVTPSERRPIVLGDWKITPPAAGGQTPLTVDFPRPLDEALLADALHVARAGEGIAGTVSISEEGRRWSFTPKTPWKAGDYTLIVETRLEDLAGNRIGRAFDVDTVAAPQPRIDKASESLGFSIR